MEHPNENAMPSPEGQQNTSLSEQDLTRAKNPNPRANENIDGDNLADGDADGVGSEITDGEAS